MRQHVKHLLCSTECVPPCSLVMVTFSLLAPMSAFAATGPLHRLLWLPEELFPAAFTWVTAMQLSELVQASLPHQGIVSNLQLQALRGPPSV